jgi:transposase-like protein
MSGLSGPGACHPDKPDRPDTSISLIVDGGSGLERALAGLWGVVPTQRCTVHKHRNLLAHAPQRLHEELSADYNDVDLRRPEAAVRRR